MIVFVLLGLSLVSGATKNRIQSIEYKEKVQKEKTSRKKKSTIIETSELVDKKIQSKSFFNSLLSLPLPPSLHTSSSSSPTTHFPSLQPSS